MTDSVFLQFIAKLMMPVLIMFSLFLLLRGHNEPGGGFVGGLVGSGSIVLMVMAYGPDEVRRRLHIDFLRAMLYGIFLAVIAGVIGLISGGAFLQSSWRDVVIQSIGQLDFGTPMLFDIGVYIAVFGVTVSIVMNMAEEGERDIN